MANDIKQQTANLFGDLWHRYDDKLFAESVSLFAMRFKANGFPLDSFRGKECLDAGCGGGRYSIAMAELGAKNVIGVDISTTGLVDARRRATSLNLDNVVKFQEASVLDLPFEDESFDFVCCSGVLHHTPNSEKGLGEISRVLRPGGKAYLLLYGKGGLRWPTIMQLRPLAQKIGYETMNEMIILANLPANKQRTFLDDLFVPLIDFYDWDEVQTLLEKHQFSSAVRWEKGKLDHEANVDVQRKELQQLVDLFARGLEESGDTFYQLQGTIRQAYEVATLALQALIDAQKSFEAGEIDNTERDWRVFGWGHHRVIAVKQG